MSTTHRQKGRKEKKKQHLDVWQIGDDLHIPPSLSWSKSDPVQLSSKAHPCLTWSWACWLLSNLVTWVSPGHWCSTICSHQGVCPLDLQEMWRSPLLGVCVVWLQTPPCGSSAIFLLSVLWDGGAPFAHYGVVGLGNILPLLLLVCFCRNINIYADSCLRTHILSDINVHFVHMLYCCLLVYIG